MKTLDFAITPCPNDIFSYFYWMKENDKSRGESAPFKFSFLDIEDLNRAAAKGKFAVTKLSFPAYLRNKDKYEILSAGAALGIGTGPVLIGVNKKTFFEKLKNSELPPKILVPGLRTTATMLLKFFLNGKNAQIRSVNFRKIIELIKKGEAEFGVVIHEGRFVYEDSSLDLVTDLGEYWTWKTSLPVPLGCICVRKDCLEFKSEIEELIRKSLRYAFDNEPKTLPTVRDYAQYLEEDVLKKHIHSFVNDYSFDCSGVLSEILKYIEFSK